MSIMAISGIAYVVLALLSKPAIKNANKTQEKIVFLFLGTIFTLSSIWSPAVLAWSPTIFQVIWFMVGIIYSAAATLSFIGIVQWNVLWQDNTSNAAQMCMWLWDAAIALSAFTMM